MFDKIFKISIDNQAFPSLLREIYNPPIQLYIRGNVEILQHPLTIAIVGSRQANAYGEQCIQNILPPTIDNGAVIVSGLACGIDSLSHQACVNKHRPTIAVLGSGINDSSIYPSSHINLAHNIIKYGGAVISEYPPNTSPHKDNFPARNRIISGLCKTTLIIQAAKRSGSLITARLALEQNRDVCVIPGPITDPLSTGTNNLLQQGATPILCSSDLINFLNIKPTKNNAQLNLALNQKLLDDHPASLNKSN